MTLRLRSPKLMLTGTSPPLESAREIDPLLAVRGLIGSLNATCICAFTGTFDELVAGEMTVTVGLILSAAAPVVNETKTKLAFRPLAPTIPDVA